MICGCLSPRSSLNGRPNNAIKPIRDSTPIRQMNNDSSNPLDIVVDFGAHRSNQSNESDDDDNEAIPI